VDSGSLPQEASQISVAAFDPLTPDDYRDSRDRRKTERLLGKNRAIGKEDSSQEIPERIAQDCISASEEQTQTTTASRSGQIRWIVRVRGEGVNHTGVRAGGLPSEKNWFQGKEVG